MGITLSFESYEEMIGYAKELLGGQVAPVPVRKEEVPQNTTPLQMTPVNPSSLQLPVSAITGREPVQQPAPTQVLQQPTQQPVQQPTQQPVQQPTQQPVQTAQRTYTLDELASAAMQLMDKGLQTQLQELLAGYQVDALPALPVEQYGNFATALRGLGAQI